MMQQLRGKIAFMKRYMHPVFNEALLMEIT